MSEDKGKVRGTGSQDVLSIIIDFFVRNPNAKYDELSRFVKSKGIDYYDMDYALTDLASSFVGFMFEGKYANADLSSVDADQLARGTEVEREHTSKDIIAKKIALDHLAEIPDYYTRLDKMESEALS